MLNVNARTSDSDTLAAVSWKTFVRIIVNVCHRISLVPLSVVGSVSRPISRLVRRYSANLTNMSSAVNNFFRSITIEPVVFLFQFGVYINKGSQLSTNLIIWKICHMQLNHSEDICQNLTDHSNGEIQSDVLRRVNHFLLSSQLLGSVPSIFFALIAGSLSDDFGRKPLIKWPLIGYFISSILMIINYAYIKSLPLEFFYFEQLWFFFGGMMVYYMGMYGYGTDITTPDERAYRLARLDASEYLAMTIAPLISPYLFNIIGYYGCYSIQTLTTFMSLSYLTFLIEEPVKRDGQSTNDFSSKNEADVSLAAKFGQLFHFFIVDPLVKMAKTMMKKRSNNRRFLLLLQIIVYFLYWFSEGDGEITYLFMVKEFKSDAADYSRFITVISLLGVFGLFIVMPILIGKLQLHETSVNVGITTSVGIGLFSAVFAKNLFPEFYLGYILTFMRICQYSAGRSIFTKTVDKDEVGKVFSAVAVVAAVSPFLSNLIFRGVYDQTLETFPSAYLLVASAVFLLATVINVVLWSNRSALNCNTVEDEEECKYSLLGGADLPD